MRSLSLHSGCHLWPTHTNYTLTFLMPPSHLHDHHFDYVSPFPTPQATLEEKQKVQQVLDIFTLPSFTVEEALVPAIATIGAPPGTSLALVPYTPSTSAYSERAASTDFLAHAGADEDADADDDFELPDIFKRNLDLDDDDDGTKVDDGSKVGANTWFSMASFGVAPQDLGQIFAAVYKPEDDRPKQQQRQPKGKVKKGKAVTGLVFNPNAEDGTHVILQCTNMHSTCAFYMFLLILNLLLPLPRPPYYCNYSCILLTNLSRHTSQRPASRDTPLKDKPLETHFSKTHLSKTHLSKTTSQDTHLSLTNLSRHTSQRQASQDVLSAVRV